MKFLVEVPGQPDTYGDYLDEMECRATVRRSGLVPDMSVVKVTPMLFWLRPVPGVPVSGPYTEDEAYERLFEGAIIHPQQALLMGPHKKMLRGVACNEDLDARNQALSDIWDGTAFTSDGITLIDASVYPKRSIHWRRNYRRYLARFAAIKVKLDAVR